MYVTEQKLGINAKLMNVQENPRWDDAADADIHVCHTYFPAQMHERLTKKKRIVWVQHGTPEHVFTETVQEIRQGQYGMSDPFMVQMNYLQRADARVTFWPRHQWWMQSMCDNGTKVHLVPMGLDLDFWAGGVNKGKFSGNPSLFTAENGYSIKWPFDLYAIWRDVYETIPGAVLHSAYLPQDHHRLWFPYANRIGAHYGAHLTSRKFSHLELRDVFQSIDYYIGLVRYGDHNRMSLEANAAGRKTISYRGNVYADHWLTEGDQRTMRDELIAILRGEVKPRVKTPVPSAVEMSKAMIKIYRSIL